MSTLTLLLFVGGGILLIGGAELLVRGASRMAIAAGITPLVVGLVIVAFGTSAPELAVTVGSAWAGESDVALGNVVGSNVFNILVVLGLSAVVAPLIVSQQLVRFDVPLLIAAGVLVLFLGLDGVIGRVDGALLAAGVITYTIFLIRQSRKENSGITQEYEEAFGEAPAGLRGWVPNIAFVGVGIGMLVVGAGWLVDAAVTTAEALGVSELVIGLTIVSAGTSLPEVATSVLASIRGERDIAVGNAVGSSIFNLLAVLGFGSIVAPAGVSVPPGALTFDIPVMIAVSVAALPVFFTGYLIRRWEGAVFLAYYGVYLTYLVLDATEHERLPELGAAMTWFVLPLTALTLGVLAFQWYGSGNRDGGAGETTVDRG